jgi:hypothetical protein
MQSIKIKRMTVYSARGDNVTQSIRECNRLGDWQTRFGSWECSEICDDRGERRRVITNLTPTSCEQRRHLRSSSVDVRGFLFYSNRSHMRLCSDNNDDSDNNDHHEIHVRYNQFDAGSLSQHQRLIDYDTNIILYKHNDI